MLITTFLALVPPEHRFSVEPVLLSILKAYSKSQRHYHNLIHIEFGLEDYFDLYDEIDVVDFFAWVYHDIVYNPMDSDNEAQSAARFLADSKTLGLDLEFADMVSTKILDTTHANPSRSRVQDMDLSILGKDERTYDNYSRSIRLEYSLLPEDAFNMGRIQVLEKLLTFPFLYSDLKFRDKYEEQAKKNLQREVDILSKK